MKHRANYSKPPSPRQVHYLQLLANGKQVKEIAYEEGLFVNGIHDQVAIAKKRLGARTVPHAVAIALARGIITLENS